MKIENLKSIPFIFDRKWILRIPPLHRMHDAFMYQSAAKPDKIEQSAAAL